MDDDTRQKIRHLAAGDALPTNQSLLAGLADLGLTYKESHGLVELTDPLELLDENLIAGRIGPDARGLIRALEIFWEIGSTNTYLLSEASKPDFNGRVCLAEQQLAGKGRRGRHWVSPFGKNIYMSIAQRVPAGTGGVGGLSLVVGMTVVEVLRSAGVEGVGLKWPNDVLLADGKLAGILVEVAASKKGEINLVIGIGINLQLQDRDAASIEQPFSTLAGSGRISRNQLAGAILNSLMPELAKFEVRGFAPFASRWDKYDLYHGAEVRVVMAEKEYDGICRGIDKEGNLLLEAEMGIKSFNAGEVSLRKVND